MEVILRICTLYMQGCGKDKICKILNRDGIPAPNGRIGYPYTVHEILVNVKYAGDLLL